MIHTDIKMTNLEMTPAIQAHLDKRVVKIEKFVKADDARALVELAKVVGDQRSGDIFRAEMNLQVAGQQFYVAREREDIYIAIDEMQSDIIRELKRSKGRRETLFRRGGRKIKKLLRR